MIPNTILHFYQLHQYSIVISECFKFSDDFVNFFSVIYTSKTLVSYVYKNLAVSPFFKYKNSVKCGILISSSQRNVKFLVNRYLRVTGESRAMIEQEINFHSLIDSKVRNEVSSPFTFAIHSLISLVIINKIVTQRSCYLAFQLKV